MNPNVEPPLPGLPPPQPHRPSTSCDRHPREQFTGFCPSCLCERLAVLEPSSSAAASSSRKPPIAATTSTATAALKAIFKPSGGGGTRPGFFPELRRTKSFSASKNEGFSGVFEPQRKSCDVRARNTLWSLFHQEATANGRLSGFAEAEPRNSASSSSVVQDPVFESKEEDQSKSETDREEEDIEIIEEQPPNVTAPTANLIEEKVEEIVEEYEEEPCQEEELKPMKDHIDLDSQTKKASGRDFKEIAGSFWSAASVFSKKLQKWRQKQKLKKSRCGSVRLPVEKPLGRQYRETQSEIADYGFGRRSCDTDPRFSLDAARMSFDAARMSFDDPRYSFDEPRASWDGYMLGRMFPRMPTMVSLVENAPVPHVIRSDTQIPVEDDPTAMNSINEDESLPGGSAQIRDYYSDSRRRKSLDRSSSCRKTAAAVVAEMDEMKPVSNTNVSSATVDYFHGPKLVMPDRDSNSNSLRDNYSDTFEIGLRDNASVIGNGEQKESSKKSRRWSKAWSIWGFIHRKSVNKDEDEDRYSRGNGVERSYSESWPEFRGDRNGDVRGGFNPKVLRSNSSVSWRNSSSFGAGLFSSARKSCDVEPTGQSRKKTNEFVWERNRSSRYSANNIDNGLLRFYMAPNGSRRGGSGKTRASHAHSIARTLLRLY
ncbi:auxin transporter-like protein 2-like [Hibiscus syriacus]|uniref:Auxin transporter-like protein 2-like n=1 Tax=Hibiscus syriacus TaxID=106335 RepID=A0A6A3CY96_HIBSY|nr:protein OCTOPUS-like [Hibiscus syriacus]KAE8734363.1 auxin transporter-like protein 2-like [Hibiscus syriacus]